MTALAAVLTAAALATLVLGALLGGFYLRYRISEAPEREEALRSAVLESVWLASSLFGGLLAAFVGYRFGGRAGAGLGLLAGVPLGMVAALRFSPRLRDLIVRCFLGR